MRLRVSGTLLAAAFLLSGCGSDYGSASLDTDDQKASYGIGRQMGQNLKPAQSRLDMAAFIRGVQDAMADVEPAVPDSVVQMALEAFSQAVMEEQQAQQEAAATRNLEEGQAYLAENGAKEGVVTTESGLQYEVLREGDGPSPTADSRVSIHYKGTLIDGTQFDSSYDRNEPAVFGVGGVIAGFSEALQLMPVGSHYRFVVPGDLAYGPNGSGQTIGPNATLIFEIELLEIVE
ncbi:MAG: FKBP-type peptidyl-prolyl cis-trans isomerase [Gemmatimonadota bacterium]